MATERLTGSLRSYGRAGARIQDAITSRAARPRKLALAAYALFALTFVATFPQWAAIAAGAIVLNGLVTLAAQPSSPPSNAAGRPRYAARTCRCAIAACNTPR